jgi:hypothetical protein
MKIGVHRAGWTGIRWALPSQNDTPTHGRVSSAAQKKGDVPRSPLPINASLIAVRRHDFKLKSTFVHISGAGGAGVHRRHLRGVYHPHSRDDAAPLLDAPWRDRLVPESGREGLRQHILARMDLDARAAALRAPGFRAAFPASRKNGFE